MKTIPSTKSSVFHIALVIILTGILIAGCANKPVDPSTSIEPAQSGSPQTSAASATEEPTLPPIPTVASVSIPTSMVLKENSGFVTSTPKGSPAGAATPAATAAAPVSCTAPAALTQEETEGPYFKAGSPERTDLYQAGMAGTKLVLTGMVLTTDCKPVARARVDFWQADSSGTYDNSGYTLRGYQYTDESGRYKLVTIVPGLYPGRTEHIHVKVKGPNGPLLTTQLYFPEMQTNKSDSIFNPNLAMSVQETADGLQAQFNFIITP